MVRPRSTGGPICINRLHIQPSAYCIAASASAPEEIRQLLFYYMNGHDQTNTLICNRNDIEQDYRFEYIATTPCVANFNTVLGHSIQRCT